LELIRVIEFTDQVAIVTGAGRGLGRHFALDLARRGASVVVNDLGSSMEGQGADASVADEVVEEIRASGGVAVSSHDSVGSPAGGRAIVESALTHFGRLDAVISNAGIYEMMPFEEIPADNWRRMINVHLDGSFYLSQPAYAVMKAQGYGRFVFMSSSGGAFGIHLAAHYAAAKAGIIGLTNNIALEGAPHGIMANTVLPFGQTRMAAIGGEPREGSLLAMNAPELVVPIVVFLASSTCSVSHHNYSACAGRFARVFMGAADGWYAQSEPAPTADDIAANLNQISAAEPFTIPGSIVDEMETVAQHLGVDI
jgi:NAD(P)-dependent dehydrogenase (short-subunit alcohol dehydrogenase family)